MRSEYKKLVKDSKHYIPLLSILLAGIAGFIIFSYDIAFQISVLVATSAGYVTWGIAHHYLHKDLEVSVAIEYIIVGALGLLIALSILFRG